MSANLCWFLLALSLSDYDFWGIPVPCGSDIVVLGEFTAYMPHHCGVA